MCCVRKAVTKSHVWCDSNDMKCAKQANDTDTENRLVVASGLRGWGEMGVTAEKYGVSFWG